MRIFSKNNDKDDFFHIIDMDYDTETANGYGVNNSSVSHALTPEEILSENTPNSPSDNVESPLEALKKRMMNQASADTGASVKDNENRNENISSAPIEANKNTELGTSSLNESGEKKKSLLEKCMPYIVDDNGKKPDDEKPAYNLESVADILTGIILFFIIGCEFFINYKINLSTKHKEAK